MIVAIDATNIRAGGGLVHLREIIQHGVPGDHGIASVIVWCDEQTASKLPSQNWLTVRTSPLLGRHFLFSAAWRQLFLDRQLKVNKTDVLLVPGGVYSGAFRPFVAISQNMLPFEAVERRRYGWSRERARAEILAVLQPRTFKTADGLLLLTEYARRRVQGRLGRLPSHHAIVPLGCSAEFAADWKVPAVRGNTPFRILYISIVDVYKHQDHVIRAAQLLHRAGRSVILELIGPACEPALSRVRRALAEAVAEGLQVHYAGALARSDLPQRLAGADILIFASSCETMPNILLEYMAAGRPIACSNRGPMPEILADAGVYFDPEAPTEIAAACCRLMDNALLREACVKKARSRVSRYHWAKCAADTFEVLVRVARAHPAGAS